MAVLYALRKYCYFVRTPRIKSFHYQMFHGLAQREGLTYPNEPNCSLRGQNRSPLHLLRSGSRIPRLFQPSLGLIVDSEVRSGLSKVRSIEFLEVIFDKIFDCPYEAGDHSWHRSHVGYQPEQLFESLAEMPQLRKGIGSYFEVLTYSNDEVLDLGMHAASIELKIAHEECRVLASELLSEHVPLYHYNGCYIMAGAVWEILRPIVDMDYFDVVELPA